MEIQNLFNNAMVATRQETLKNSDQLTLGELILKLEPILEKCTDKNSEPTVVYDFEYLFPNGIDSWRGSYSELALNYNTDGDEMVLSDFVKMLKDTIGKTFTGYKGGDFTMSKMTPIWVANYGRSGHTAVIDVLDEDYQVVLITGKREF